MDHATETGFEVIPQAGTRMCHVVPVNDMMEHVTRAGLCPCGPQRVTDEDGTIYRHHSLDGRETEAPGALDDE